MCFLIINSHKYVLFLTIHIQVANFYLWKLAMIESQNTVFLEKTVCFVKLHLKKRKPNKRRHLNNSAAMGSCFEGSNSYWFSEFTNCCLNTIGYIWEFSKSHNWSEFGWFLLPRTAIRKWCWNMIFAIQVILQSSLIQRIWINLRILKILLQLFWKKLK